MALVADSWDDLKAMLELLGSRCHNMNLSISTKKTKILAVLPTGTCKELESISLNPDDDSVEVVSNFQ